jgi:phenylacetate-coenzyme A ligase PaaK-like adenylate-forming protein
MTEAIEQVEESTFEPQPQTTTPEQQLAIVEQQMQERLRVLAANDPIYQRGVGQRDILVALTSPPSNGKVPDDA